MNKETELALLLALKYIVNSLRIPSPFSLEVSIVIKKAIDRVEQQIAEQLRY